MNLEEIRLAIAQLPVEQRAELFDGFFSVSNWRPKGLLLSKPEAERHRDFLERHGVKIEPTHREDVVTLVFPESCLAWTSPAFRLPDGAQFLVMMGVGASAPLRRTLMVLAES